MYNLYNLIHSIERNKIKNSNVMEVGMKFVSYELGKKFVKFYVTLKHEYY